MPRKKSFEPKIGALKKELRELRLKECPPITKMKKVEVKAELLRLRGEKFMEKTSLPEDTLSKLKAVETETKGRNVARKEEAEKVVEAVSTLQKKVRGRKSTSKAMEGLKKVDSVDKLEKERKELNENAEKMRSEDKKSKAKEMEKINKMEDISSKEYKARKAIYNQFNDKVKEGIVKGLKNMGKDITIDDFIKTEKFRDILELREKIRKTTLKSQLQLTAEDKKEMKLYEKLKNDDDESVASASDVEEKPKRSRKSKVVEAPKAEPPASEKKERFKKGSAEAKAHMASIRAKKGK